MSPYCILVPPRVTKRAPHFVRTAEHSSGEFEVPGRRSVELKKSQGQKSLKHSLCSCV